MKGRTRTGHILADEDLQLKSTWATLACQNKRDLPQPQHISQKTVLWCHQYLLSNDVLMVLYPDMVVLGCKHWTCWCFPWRILQALAPMFEMERYHLKVQLVGPCPSPSTPPIFANANISWRLYIKTGWIENLWCCKSFQKDFIHISPCPDMLQWSLMWTMFYCKSLWLPDDFIYLHGSAVVFWSLVSCRILAYCWFTSRKIAMKCWVICFQSCVQQCVSGHIGCFTNTAGNDAPMSLKQLSSNFEGCWHGRIKNSME